MGAMSRLYVGAAKRAGMVKAANRSLRMTRPGGMIASRHCRASPGWTGLEAYPTNTEELRGPIRPRSVRIAAKSPHLRVCRGFPQKSQKCLNIAESFQGILLVQRIV